MKVINQLNINVQLWITMNNIDVVSNNYQKKISILKLLQQF